ncbi:S-methyl-5-thioribose-1-phosphate isomerase [Methylobacillus gramineus]|uniref:S-methyl-5-thioribose-1-phosphate isomerase n=1 Tax=Methylobacillus gramineus TaxID=755169 RepID=UPI001CFFEA7E|nr:S-methyl-5-thioribose-1-phosphate isomerase [Methylobacillus gramineus]MCB5183847.1 S-methyl-5-thioribose-1-phosphate isomerase [Methylobacillus gramineus]
MKIGQQQFRTIWPADNDKSPGLVPEVNIIDQTRLPHTFSVVGIASVDAMAKAIREMQVRGAPLIGAAAAYGLALATLTDAGDDGLRQAATLLLSSRPTAVNLRWAVERMLGRLLSLPVERRCVVAWEEAANICDEDVILNQAIGRHGLDILQGLAAAKSGRLNILTHCNAGWLATVDWGTALAPVYTAVEAGLDVHVWVDETRPRNQGASLTAWELAQHGVAHTVITDNAGGHLMQHGQVDCVIVGADRVTRTGDVCNKIGTYLKALAAFDNDIPFYAAVPSPTIDWRISDGLRDIQIEERDADEVAMVNGLDEHGEVRSVRVIPYTSQAANPAFDVTPARLVTGIITEHGCCTPAQLKQWMPATEITV